MAGTKPIIYFDSCIFISMLTGERRKGTESARVAGLIKLIDNKEIVVVTSSITRVEVLECTLTEQQKEIMNRLIRAPKVQVKESTTPIMDMAHEIRAYYQAMKQRGETNLPTVETPDAIHLSTAIHYDCEAFYTFDEKDTPGGSRPKRGLIPLSGNVAGRYPLKICEPQVEELGLSL